MRKSQEHNVFSYFDIILMNLFAEKDIRGFLDFFISLHLTEQKNQIR